MSNKIGKRGESIFATVDFHVSLLEYPFKGFFYASVKTTTLGYYPGGERMRIHIDSANIEQLWKEVAEYWDNSRKMTKFVSSFN